MVKININTDMSPELAAKLFAWGLAVADKIVSDKDGGKVRLGDLTPDGVHYLGTYGYRKSKQDSVSGVVDAIKEAAKAKDAKAWAKFAAESDAGVSGEIFPPHNATVEMVTAAVLAKRMGKRHDAIVASSIPVKEANGRLSARDAWVRDFATKKIAAICEEKSAAMYKGDELESKRAKYIAARPDFFESAWQAHLATMKMADEIDLDTL